MRLSHPVRLLVPVLATLIAVPAWAASGDRALAAPQLAAPTYYLALGDSLAAGYQSLPGGRDGVGHGYAGDIAATLADRAARANRRFTFLDLGCRGETTQTMIRGGCVFGHFSRGPQLAVAEQFLRAHREDDVLVTLDIGANDVDYCAPHNRFDIPCGFRGMLGINSGLDAILTGLQAAAGPHTRIVGMNLYDPVLAWYLEPGGRVAAVASVPLTDGLNRIIDDVDAAHHVPTADVAKAFDTNSFRPLMGDRGQQVPLNVARIMQWTNMARRDIHANDTGYRVIAGAFMTWID